MCCCCCCCVPAMGKGDNRIGLGVDFCCETINEVIDWVSVSGSCPSWGVITEVEDSCFYWSFIPFWLTSDCDVPTGILQSSCHIVQFSGTWDKRSIVYSANLLLTGSSDWRALMIYEEGRDTNTVPNGFTLGSGFTTCKMDRRANVYDSSTAWTAHSKMHCNPDFTVFHGEMQTSGRQLK